MNAPSFSVARSDDDGNSANHVGTRMSADEFLAIQDDSAFYELIDGVVVVSPSPTPRHQQVLLEIILQAGNYLRDHPVGMLFPELDVHLGASESGRDVVYRPEATFVRSERVADVVQPDQKISGAPDLVVEIVSRGSRRFDSETKKDDYQRFGVREYWLIDPDRDTMTFFRLSEGRYSSADTDRDRFTSEAIPGFTLDLARLRELFKPW